MKIRLQSIRGKIADPLYNEAMIEEAMKKAKADGIDLIVFPKNSIRPECIGSIGDNESYQEQFEEANQRLASADRLDGLRVMMYDSYGTMGNIRIEIDNYDELESVEGSFKREKKAALESDEPKKLVLVCKGRGNESCCRGVYSNEKIIAFEGEILASAFDQDVLDADLDQRTVCLRKPYLKGIDDLDEMFERILHMQGEGLIGKLDSMKRKKISIGVSGGLDSTISLIACAEAFKSHGRDLKDIIAVTMPGLGTTKRTYENAYKLMESLGVTIEDIDLRPLLNMHLRNISQPEGKYDVTFEQTQSRERTQVLLDIANRDNAVMVGTGCMSEFALGWMTYGGDHLSMFAINIGMPKTMVKMYARWVLKRFSENKKLCEAVKDILDGPVSPELLPIDEKGVQHEKTESIIGDYEVLDFWIYHIIKDGWGMKKLFRGAQEAFPEYGAETLLGWLKTFCLRFFTRQYKKNCYGDGLGLLSWSVSPFTGFGMPSDIDNGIWEKEIEEIEKEIL